MKKCFVISPIGVENSKIREQVDDVFDFIIKPAMNKCGITPVRSDHIQEPGLISISMFNSILTYDLCVAVLTFKNPNVYYELAIAHSANRPVIILIEKGEELPFDLKDLRCVFYDLKPRPLFENVYVNQIIGHIKSLEAVNWKVPSIIPELSSILAARDEAYDFFKVTHDYGTNADWENLLDTTKEKLDIMGITLNTWKSIQNFAELLLTKGMNECQIRILLMHPENPALRQIINDNISEIKYEEICYQINSNMEYYSKIAEKNENIEVRQIKNGCPTHGQTIVDECGMYSPYFYSKKTTYSPLWKCKRESDLYKLLTEEFEAIWRLNE